jgi:Domain of unknown function (DUF1814).
MDLDLTVKRIAVTRGNLFAVFAEICAIDIADGFVFAVSGAAEIRVKDKYPDMRMVLGASFGSLKEMVKIDVTVNDKVTPKERKFEKARIFDVGMFSLMAYPIETVLAEKVETILSRGSSNTRPRDFYDVFVLTGTQPFDKSLFKKALTATCKHRGSTAILAETAERISAIADSHELQMEWGRYRKLFHYAANITYGQTIAALKTLCEIGE